MLEDEVGGEVRRYSCSWEARKGDIATLHDLPPILDIPITSLCVPGVRGAQHQGEVDGGAAES